MTLLRVFPRRTAATPEDVFSTADFVPALAEQAAGGVHISVTFLEDLPRAEELRKAYAGAGFNVLVGGPATGMPGADFAPGRYLKFGYTISSRGCPNRCWFCSVWKREGNEVRLLPITEGWNLLDDNILATPLWHFNAVCDSLYSSAANYHQRIEFTGGLEAARLTPAHIEKLYSIRRKVSQMFFAYDTPDDYEPLVEAGKLLSPAGFTCANRKARAYVLIGYPSDTAAKAEARLWQTVDAGFLPHAMLYRDGKHEPSKEWKRFQRQWARPIITSQLIMRRELLK